MTRADKSSSGAPATGTGLSAWLQYSAGLIIYGSLLLFILGLIIVRGGFAHPPLFLLFRRLLYVQYAVLGTALLATLLYFGPRRMHWSVRVLLFALLHLCFVWVLLWSLVNRAFGIELTVGTVAAVLMNRAPISAMGVNSLEFAWAVAASFAAVAALTALSEFAARRYADQIRGRFCVIFIMLFAIVHLPTRAYFAYEISHNNQAALAFDDCLPFPLQTERLWSALNNPRIALPNFESQEATQKYLDHLRTFHMPAIPHGRNIVWINIESLRFDAINEQTMPNVSRYRDRFQIQLSDQHWSSGNATQFAVFAMLTGLSGYHLYDFQRAGANSPFLSLLHENGYRLRVAKKAHIVSAGLLTLLPTGTVITDIDTHLNGGDVPMVDAYLKDRRARTEQPSFDFLAFDATHWPYSFPPEDAVFQPAPPNTSSYHLLRSDRDLEPIRNRYRNACHFVDAQIGRVLDDLRDRGDFDRTVIVLLGDHGEEFQERGQLTHSAVLNDFQGRTVLWMHLPDMPPERLDIGVPTVHTDIVPTILESFGFSADMLYTQGVSLLDPIADRPMLSLCEQGRAIPAYRALVTSTYISRWRYTPAEYLFSGVQRRDGGPVEGDDWLGEVRALYPGTLPLYELLPDVSRPPRAFLPASKAVAPTNSTVKRRAR